MEEEILLCSNCFQDEGLKLDAIKIGLDIDVPCPNCKTKTGKKLNKNLTLHLAHRFFVVGTLHKYDFGAAPRIQFNHYQYKKTSIDFNVWLNEDIKLIEEAAKVGLFHYGPRAWMYGQNEPLKSLISKGQREKAVQQIIKMYPYRNFSGNEVFYRLRKNPKDPSNIKEYDSPPISGHGRLDSNSLSIMYGSQDLEVCIHECRVTIEDDLYLATLYPTKELKLLDLTELIEEEHVTEFESIDLAIQMLFFAGEHSYEISREMCLIIRNAGYDGVIYPSYFSTIRTGTIPFETVMGMSVRRFKQLKERIKSLTIQNIGLFGKPIEEDFVRVKCINKLILNRVFYDIQFGPLIK